jgi:hypothetical protein
MRDGISTLKNSYIRKMEEKSRMLDFMIEREARIVPNPDGTCYLSFVLDGVHRNSSPNVSTGYEAIKTESAAMLTGQSLNRRR